MKHRLETLRHPPILRDARMALARLLPHVDLLLTVLVALAILFGVLLSTGLTFATGALVGAVPGALRGRDISSPAGEHLIAALITVLVIFVLVQVLAPIRDQLLYVLGRRLEAHLQTRTMRAALSPTGIAHLEDPALLDLVSRARSSADAHYKPSMALMGLADIVEARLGAIASVALIAIFFQWWFAVGIFVALWLARIIARRSTGEVMEAYSGATGSYRRSDYFLLDLALGPETAKETRVFGLGDWVANRFRSHWQEATERIRKARRKRLRSSVPWSALLVFCVVLAALALVGHAAAVGEIGLTSLAVVAPSILGLTGNLLSASHTEPWLDYGSTSVPAVLELEERTSDALADRQRDPDGLPRQEIRFEDVRFSYSGTAHSVFNRLDLVIPAGRSLAIVGENGAGKTTLIKLLLRLYEPTGGRITADGTDLREFDSEAWRRRLAVIFQNFARYELTAAENVSFGAVERSGDREALDRAARRAGAVELISKLPHGWDTVLSRQYEGGADLSGGQWQRVALARALFAVEAGAGVLVLDEPTANLDVRAEAELFERFLELTQGLTTILISHRFSTVRQADTICVLEKGRVVERGTHEELMVLGGRYARMYALQAARFSDQQMGEREEGAVS